MPATNVSWPPPLTRFPTLWPGQMGVEGTDHNRGERMHCTGEIFYVDPNYPGASDARDGTSPTDPMLTVAGALAKCQGYRGDVVVVMANNNWEYDNTGDATIGYNTIVSEQVTMSVPGVRLIGLNPAGTTGVPWLNPADDGTCITVTACNCTIEGFAFFGHQATGAGTAILASYVNAYGDNLTVKHCVFDEYFEEGILLQHSWNGDIYDNWFHETQSAIINDDAQSAADYNHVHHNYFRNCSTVAIYIGEASYWNVYENHIWNSSAAVGAAATDEGIEVSTGGNNLVHHNTLSCTLPGTGVGDYDDFCTAGVGDIWSQNSMSNGQSTTNPT